MNALKIIFFLLSGITCYFILYTTHDFGIRFGMQLLSFQLLLITGMILLSKKEWNGYLNEKSKNN